MSKTYEAGSKVTFIAQEHTEFRGQTIRPEDKAIVVLAVEWNVEDGLGEGGPWGYGGYTSETLERIAANIELEIAPLELDNFRIAGGDQSWPDDYYDRQELLNQVADRWESQPDFFAGNDFLVDDANQETFGRFHSIPAAAKAVRESNPSWWAEGPTIAPTPDDFNHIEFEDSDE